MLLSGNTIIERLAPVCLDAIKANAYDPHNPPKIDSLEWDRSKEILIYPAFDEKKGNSQGVLSFGKDHAGYVTRLHDTVFIAKQGVLLDPKKPNPDNWIKKTADSDRRIVIPAGHFFLARTYEMVGCPNNLIARVHNKSTNLRAAVAYRDSVIEPNWGGGVTLEGCAPPLNDIVLYAHEGCVAFHFEEVQGDVDPYNGRYQGDTGIEYAKG